MKTNKLFKYYIFMLIINSVLPIDLISDDNIDYNIRNFNIVTLKKGKEILDTVNVYPGRNYNDAGTYYATEKIKYISHDSIFLKTYFIDIYDSSNKKIKSFRLDSLYKSFIRYSQIVWFQEQLLLIYDYGKKTSYKLYDIKKDKIIFDVKGYFLSGTNDEFLYFQKKDENSYISLRNILSRSKKDENFLRFDGEIFEFIKIEEQEYYDYIFYNGYFTTYSKYFEKHETQFLKTYYNTKLINVCNYNSIIFNKKNDIYISTHYYRIIPECFFIIFNKDRKLIIPIHEYLENVLSTISRKVAIKIEDNIVGFIYYEWEEDKGAYIFDLNTGEFIKKAELNIIRNDNE